ncbi:MAG: hypothetical protein ACP5VQ_11040, partial [Phycisphaerae bacterium]
NASNAILSRVFSSENHIYWPKLRAKGPTVQVHHLLRQLHNIRLGRLEVKSQSVKTKVPRIPMSFNRQDWDGWTLSERGEQGFKFFITKL